MIVYFTLSNARQIIVLVNEDILGVNGLQCIVYVSALARVDNGVKVIYLYVKIRNTNLWKVRIVKEANF